MKILVEMKHGLGDCICDLPMLKLLRDNFPDAFIGLIVNNKVNEDLIRMSGIKVDEFYYLSIKNNTFVASLKLLIKLRLKNFDYGILATMTPKIKGKLFFSMLGIKHRIGEQYEGRNFFDLDDDMHFVDRNIRLIEPFCKKHLSSIDPYIRVDQKYLREKFQSLNNDKPIIGICIGNGDTSPYKGSLVYTRGWGIANIKQLIIAIKSNANFNIFLFGGKQEEKLLKYLEDILEDNYIYSFVGKTNIVQSATLAKMCRLVVGVDTGMQHIADAVGTKTLSIFGPTNYRTHGAYSKRAEFIECQPKLQCQYCFTNEKYYACKDRRCLAIISVEDVFDRILKIMEEATDEKVDN